MTLYEFLAPVALLCIAGAGTLVLRYESRRVDRKLRDAKRAEHPIE